MTCSERLVSYRFSAAEEKIGLPDIARPFRQYHRGEGSKSVRQAKQASPVETFGDSAREGKKNPGRTLGVNRKKIDSGLGQN